MAVTLTLVNVTPFKLVYRAADDGGGGSAARTSAQMVTDAETRNPTASPIAELVGQAAASDAAAIALMQQLQPGKISMSPPNVPLGTSWALVVDSNGNTNPRFTVTGPGTASFVFVIVEFAWIDAENKPHVWFDGSL